MSYRRMGDGLRGNNRSFSQPFQSGPVNPWQGGSNANQGGILSQLTSNPQLALALTSLLQPQQQQPPSLLSLNTSAAFSHDRGDYGRFPANRGREFRRPEPYYKNRGGFGDRRRRSPRRDNKKNDKKDKKGDKKDDKSKVKEEGDASMEDDEKESKRDWKDEKNQAEGKESGDEGEGKKGEKEGKYSGVPRKYLNCFVCNKQMWDGESMGKHVRGRAHQEMMKALEESIHICVSILRENMRLTEDRKMIELNRQNRLKRYGKRRDSELSHCNMCDLKFMGKIVAHRRTDGHQRLKNYLHPKCKVCDKEYPSRLEWIDHRLTPEHLRSLAKSIDTDDDDKDGQVITEGDGEDLNLEPLLDQCLEMESEDAILEVSSPLEGFQSRLPAYKPDRPLATESLKEFNGWMCELCNRSFADEQDAQDHLKTRRHFYRFIEVIKEKFEEKERREKAEKEAAEKKKRKEKEAAEKIKTENGEEGGEENGEKVEDGEKEEVDLEEETEGDADMYDPAETTEEKENGEGLEEEESAEIAETVEAKMDTTVEEEEEEEEEEKVEPEPKKVAVKEVKKEPPPTPKTPAKKLGGPKSKRGKK